MIWAKIIAGLVGLADKVAAIFKTKQDQAAGVAIQVAADQTANVEASKNAAMAAEHNAALDHDELVDKLRDQTGARP